MTKDDGQKVRCPVCGHFVARVMSSEAEVEVNCGGSRCGATLIVRRENGQVTVAVTEKHQQA